MTGTFVRFLRHGFDFAKRYRWRLAIAVCFAAVVAAGDYAFQSQYKTLEAEAVNQDGTLILVKELAGNRLLARKVINENGRTIRKLSESVVTKPSFSRAGNLIWLKHLKNRRSVIRKLDLSSNSDPVEVATLDFHVLAALEDHKGRIAYSAVVGDETRRTDSFVVYSDHGKQVERHVVGRYELCVGSCFRDRNGQFQLITDVYPRGHGRGDNYAITDGVNRTRLVYDPVTQQLTSTPIRPDERLTESTEHLIVRTQDRNTQNKYEVYRRGTQDVLLFGTPRAPTWLAGDMFFQWEHGVSAVEFYAPGETPRIVLCGQVASALPVNNEQLLVSTMNGLLQTVDAKTGVVRTIRNVRWGWRSCAVFAAIGLPMCVGFWLWLSWRQSDEGRLSPLTDLLLLLIGVTLAASNWLQSAGALGWRDYLSPTTGVLAWTLLGTLSLFAVNCRSILGSGLAVLLTVLAGVMFVFKARVNYDTGIFLNSGGLFIILMVVGCLSIRSTFGRFMMPRELDAKTVERQVSLRQIVILTCCFAAVFSVMSFYGMYFTLDVEWKRLAPALVLAMVVLMPLATAMHTNRLWLWFGVWLVAATILPHAYLWADGRFHADTRMDLIAFEAFVNAWALGWSTFADRWFNRLFLPLLQFATPSFLIMLIVRYCRSAGMRIAKELR